jgi:hypothetical protein
LSARSKADLKSNAQNSTSVHAGPIGTAYHCHAGP